MSVVPMIHDSISRFSYDIYSRLLKDRIIWLNEEITDYTSKLICTQLMYLESEGKELEGEDQAIHFYINSPGGSVFDGLAIYDVMNYISCPVYTYCVGCAMSMGADLLAAGEKGHRYAFENAEIMIHQMLGGVPHDQVAQVQKRAEHLNKLKIKMDKLLAKNTGQKLNKIEKDTDRDYFMTAEEALEYGIIDHIIKP